MFSPIVDHLYEDGCHPFMEKDLGSESGDFYFNSGLDQVVTHHVKGIGLGEVPSEAQVVITDQKQPFVSGISEILGQRQSSTIPCILLELLSKFRMSHDQSNGGRIDKERDPIVEGKELSTEEVMRVAAAHFIQLSTQSEDDPTAVEHPFRVSLQSLTQEEKKNVDLASLLFAAAKEVSIQQYNRAMTLLSQCNNLASSTGNPVQRVVYYFLEALRERLDREKSTQSPKRARDRGIPTIGLTNHPMELMTQQILLFSQLSQFTLIQTIIDNVASDKRIHMIDLSIKHGFQWTIFMQALSTRSSNRIDRFKLSAIGTSEEAIATVGKSLADFAESLSLPFEFKPIIVSDMQDLEVDMFEVEKDEVIGVYSSMDMNLMISRPDCLEKIMRILRKLRPCIMVVADFETKHNSPSFVNRFTEALFYHSAVFDCLDAAMDRDDINRMIIEAVFCSEAIKSIVSAEGSERVVRQVGVEVWRLFFKRFGLVEAELNEWSQFQGSLLTEKFAHRHRHSVNFIKNGKSLMIGWKGTPLIFISAWKL